MQAAEKLMSVRRDLRERDVRVVLVALVIAVATVATIALFANQLQRTLVSSASSFLAADRQLEAENGRPIPDSWLDEARALGLETGRMVEFSTMISGPDGFQMASIKAVSNEYPLRGEVEIQRQAPDGQRETLAAGPQPGEVWINPRLLRLLDLSIGDKLAVGERQLEVAALLVREPDGGFRLSSLAPRVLMHVDDVAATGAVQEGSRVELVYLFAGTEAVLEQYINGSSHSCSPAMNGKAYARARPFPARLTGQSVSCCWAAVWRCFWQPWRLRLPVVSTRCPSGIPWLC